MGITILGNVGKIIEDNHGEMYFDNAKKIVGTTENSKSNHDIQDAQVVEETQDTATNACSYLELFHPEEKNIKAIEALLLLAIERSSSKKEVVKYLYANREHFNLQGKSSPKQAQILNNFQETHNIKKFVHPFSDDDFLRNYNSY